MTTQEPEKPTVLAGYASRSASTQKAAVAIVATLRGGGLAAECKPVRITAAIE